MDTLTPADVESENLPGWSVRTGDVLALCTEAATGSFSAGLEFVNRIGDLAEEANHHPDIELTYPQVRIALTTHDAGGLTAADVDLARQISAVANLLEIDLVAPAE